MARLNKTGIRTAKPAAKSPVRTTTQDTKTFEGAPAYSRDAKSDLFLLSVTNFYGEDTFYEEAGDRNQRYMGLIHQVAREDPAWLGAFLPWLRRTANIRTAAVVGAVEAARILAQADQPGHQVGAARRIINETLYRADEPAEALSYWLQTYGRKIPAPVRRGIADAAARMYSEFSYIKWDSKRRGVSMADVVELTHPTPGNRFHQSDLFKYMLDSARRPTPIPEVLTTLFSRQHIMDMSPTNKALFLASPEATTMLLTAGFTWEQVSSWGAMTSQVWEAVIPTMGYMALLRNLRNFQEAGISKSSVDYVVAKLSDPDEVYRSRQLPYRFLSAYVNATNPAWAVPLETALQLSLRNIPALPGRTLVLVDTSSSMSSVAYSAKSKVSPVMAGALFGVALAVKGEDVDLVGFADGTFEHQVRKGSSVLRETERFVGRVGEVGHGTQIAMSLRARWNGHDRVVIVTDMQTFDTSTWYYSAHANVGNQIPSNVPIYAFNMMGYAQAMMETNATRHELGGLTDQTFAMIPLVEAGTQAKWPWEN